MSQFVKNILTKEPGSLLTQIVDMLSSVDDISIEISDSGVASISKEKSKFVIIEKETIKLADKGGVFTPLKESIKTQDDFLKAATEAYWIVAKKK
ncbi:MAG: hypothetical protein COA94_01675 [Rickettsiales bacterium]|nr:MAG: hypothetical protein COA94_01675 [Rickettsiales bacterium]